MTPRHRWILVALLPLGVLVACGDDDDAASTDTETMDTETMDTETMDTETMDTETMDTETMDTETMDTETMDTSGASTGGTGGEGTDAAFCDPMEELANFNAETPAPQSTGDFESLKAELLETFQGSLDLYDEPISNAPDEIVDQLTALRDVSVEFMGSLEDATSIEDFEAAAVDIADDDVLAATAELEAYIQEYCGFGLTSG